MQELSTIGTQELSRGGRKGSMQELSTMGTQELSTGGQKGLHARAEYYGHAGA